MTTNHLVHKSFSCKFKQQEDKQVLTTDSTLQVKATSILENKPTELNALFGQTIVMEVLTGHITDGLGQPAKSDKVQITGETGAVQLEDGNYIVESCDYFPADAPQYSIIVSIHQEGLPASGGLMATDVFRQIVDYMNE